MTGRDLIGLLVVAALAALAWTWFITWSIARWGDYREDEEE